MTMLASASSLNNNVAESSISVSFALDVPLLVRSQPLLSSQDQASLAKVARLGVVMTCTSRLGWELWDDVLFWL